MGILQGKVAIITGAGNGIGRCHALLFAKEGAKVVVNDLGGDRSGSGESASAADKVVEEIRAAGGEAVANYASVADKDGAASIIQTAIDSFGRADVLVNNAGILRDKTMLKLDEANWDLVIAVHLKGTFLVSQAFAAHVKDRAETGDSGGRIVNTSSYAGLKGNFGQSNYAAAKAGIAGLTRVWSQELAKFGVTVNAIAPMAKTRMTEDISMVPSEMTPEQISPMVMYLCSDQSEAINGQIFGIHGQQIFEYQMVMTDGVTKAGQELWSVEEIAAKISQICATKAAAAPAAPAAMGPADIIDAAFAGMAEVFVPERAKGWTANIQFEIADANDWSIHIGEGLCRTVQGKDGKATCTVKVDAETWAAIVTGKEKAEKAFMTGKISADNLGDMMKLGGAFDMKKAAEKIAQLQASAAPAAASAAPAAPSMGPKDLVDAAFAGMSEVFRPERAAGWSANIQFEIAGGHDWTIQIDDGQCQTVKGKDGKATCTVKVDADTWAAVVTGEEKAEKAFMTGKISADNLGDMMKLGGAFDMKKAAEKIAELKKSASAAPAAQPAPAALGPADIIDQAFGQMAAIFVPERAKGWTANIQFEIAGGHDWTIQIDDGQCQTVQGKDGKATCTVKVDAETWAGIVTGKEKAEKAFMTGKVTADNLGDMMKLGGAFDMKKAAAMIEAAKQAQAPAQAEEPEEELPKGLNRKLIGHVYSGGHELVEQEHTVAYAKATNDENPHYVDSSRDGGVIAPLIFPVRLFKEPLFRCMMDPKLNCDMLHLVHGEQDMEFFDVLRPKDLAVLRSEISGIEDKSSGQLLHVMSRLYRDGELVTQARSSMFVRDVDAKKDKSKARADKEPEELPEPSFSQTLTVTEDQSLRYADASLDNNPIHTDRGVAKMAGLPDIILQGLCTMAFTSQALVTHTAGGDPSRVKRMKVRFTKPVLPNDTVTTQIWEDADDDGLKTYKFRAINQDGVPVIDNGRAWIAG